MKKVLIPLLMILLLCSACSSVREEMPTEPAVVETEPPMVDLGGIQADPKTEKLDLANAAFDFDLLIAAAPEFEALMQINLGQTELSGEQLMQIADAYPGAQVDYSVAFLGQSLTKETTYMDASGMTAEQTEELLSLLPALPMLQKINFVAEDGQCAYTVDTIPELDKVRLALPEAYLRVSFELFGQTVTSEDERIEYYLVDIGNEGVDTVRAVLPYLESCTYFLMDGCGVDDEIMAQLREDFPETEIVWRIWLVPVDYGSKKMLRHGSYLTDTHRIRTIWVRDENAHLLNYCTKTKYMDIGHIENLTICEFLNYMPEMEVCILAITGITDISPLANHDKLEYLELFTTDISDLSPLASCPNLEHLNISNMPNLRDLSPLYGLTKMKRLRMVRNMSLSQEEQDKLMEQLPDCEFLTLDIWPTSGFWRWKDPYKKEKVERYALLCEQMEYAIDMQEYGID